MNKKKIKKIIYYVSFVFLICILFYNLAIIFANRKNDVEIVVDEPINDVSDITNEIIFSNNDIKGIIRIPGTSINENILQYSNNDYYLSHKEDGSYSKYGSITLDYRNSIGDKKIIIYGHNSTWYGTEIVPFKELEKYRLKSYFDEHKYIEIISNTEVSKYEIFSIQDTSNYSYMNMNFSSNDEWFNHLKELKNNSLYETGVDIYSNDSILVLQTCSFKSKNNYLIVIARKVEI